VHIFKEFDIALGGSQILFMNNCNTVEGWKAHRYMSGELYTSAKWEGKFKKATV